MSGAVPAYKVIGNIYYVGEDTRFPPDHDHQGNILVNSNYERNVP